MPGGGRDFLEKDYRATNGLICLKSLAAATPEAGTLVQQSAVSSCLRTLLLAGRLSLPKEQHEKCRVGASSRVIFDQPSENVIANC